MDSKPHKYGSNVPEARMMLQDISFCLKIGVMSIDSAVSVITNQVLPLMTRKPPVRKTAARNRKLTKVLAEQIRQYAAENPDASYQHIGNVFRVNVGRVSEAMNGSDGDD